MSHSWGAYDKHSCDIDRELKKLRNQMGQEKVEPITINIGAMLSIQQIFS